ncbi:hypothetical protein BaRGS_00010452 [Batillaria attramentaria]|uniref:Uncharacterized protein n=1 Tax=Batillaria attramentaria TaxID=370345 RepID=A0ABD0LGM0_9CAEN
MSTETLGKGYILKRIPRSVKEGYMYPKSKKTRIAFPTPNSDGRFGEVACTPNNVLCFIYIARHTNRHKAFCTCDHLQGIGQFEEIKHTTEGSVMTTLAQLGRLTWRTLTKCCFETGHYRGATETAYDSSKTGSGLYAREHANAGSVCLNASSTACAS